MTDMISMCSQSPAWMAASFETSSFRIDPIQRCDAASHPQQKSECADPEAPDAGQAEDDGDRNCEARGILEDASPSAETLHLTAGGSSSYHRVAVDEIVPTPVDWRLRVGNRRPGSVLRVPVLASPQRRDAMPDSSSPLLPASPMLLGMLAALVSALAAEVQRGSERNAWEGACEARERCQEWASLTRDL